MPNIQFCCPICKNTLFLENKQWKCQTGHSFDVAKQGYVNLLPVQNKHSKQPGDNQQMLAARRDFLNAGHYQPLSDRVNELAIEFTKKTNQDVVGEKLSSQATLIPTTMSTGTAISITENYIAKTILDIGCGEGYYTNRLCVALNSSIKSIDNVLSGWDCCGLDISKVAIKYAAKSYQNLQFCVASSYDLPFADNSFDLLLRIYAPSKLSEMRRVMRKNGLLITVSPGPNHHQALKQLIYANPQLHVISSDLEGLNLIHQERLESQLTLTNEADIRNFLDMTPYAWKLSPEQKHTLSTAELSCELDFHLAVYSKST